MKLILFTVKLGRLNSESRDCNFWKSIGCNNTCLFQAKIVLDFSIRELIDSFRDARRTILRAQVFEIFV